MRRAGETGIPGWSGYLGEGGVIVFWLETCLTIRVWLGSYSIGFGKLRLRTLNMVVMATVTSTTK